MPNISLKMLDTKTVRQQGRGKFRSSERQSEDPTICSVGEKEAIAHWVVCAFGFMGPLLDPGLPLWEAAAVTSLNQQRWETF